MKRIHKYLWSGPNEENTVEGEFAWPNPATNASDNFDASRCDPTADQ